MKGLERSITENAKYIISYFNMYGKDVTNLKLQKLLYFLEAIYMVLEDKDKLFDEEFYAWNFGPVSNEIYQIYKYYGSAPIVFEDSIEIKEENLI